PDSLAGSSVPETNRDIQGRQPANRSGRTYQQCLASQTRLAMPDAVADIGTQQSCSIIDTYPTYTSLSLQDQPSTLSVFLFSIIRSSGFVSNSTRYTGSMPSTLPSINPGHPASDPRSVCVRQISTSDPQSGGSRQTRRCSSSCCSASRGAREGEGRAPSSRLTTRCPPGDG
ncbi:hypothetical protein TPAR_01256, partial [Tolypocladium paradoxum]